jgi:hypothetical protein
MGGKSRENTETIFKKHQINNKSYGTNRTASNAEYKPVFYWTVQKNLSSGGARSYGDEKA